MKKVLLLFATLFALGQNAFAYDFSVVSPSGHTLIYTIYNGNSVSVARSSNISGALIIPSSVTYNGYTFSVTSIAMNAFEGCTGMTSVTIPNSVISIASNAFERCTGLSAVTIPNSVTFIGEGAFSKCSGLTSITIPNSVTTIGVAAFSDCTWLSSVFFNADSCSLNGPSIFARCYLFTSITFGNNVKRIPSYLCKDCTSLTTVTIPDSVTSIGDYSFENCSGLTSVTLGSGVTFIGTAAFYQCDHITQMISYAPVPPPLYNGTGFYGVPNNIPVYVPTASISSYQAAPGWSVFTNYIGIVPYAITATSANPTMGSVTGGGTYAGGTTATLTATPNPGYHFVQWQDGNTQNPRSFTVTGDATYTATFAQSGTATVTTTVSQITTTSAHLDIVMGQQTSYFYLIYGPQSAFTQNGLTTDEAIISYVNQNYGSSDRNYNNVSGYMNDLTPNTTYWVIVVPYNNDGVAGTICRKQFTTSNTSGIEEVGEKPYAINCQDGRLSVIGTEGEMVNVYSVDGRCVYSAHATETAVIDVPSSGAYFVKIGNHPARKVVVIR